jgi:hypothetical protein
MKFYNKNCYDEILKVSKYFETSQMMDKNYFVYFTYLNNHLDNLNVNLCERL